MQLPDLHIDRAKNIPAAGWALIVAGAAFGGAVLHINRIVGAVLVGGLAFAYELSQAPCCADCAGGAGCGSSEPTASSSSHPLGLMDSTATGILTTHGTSSTPPLSSDYLGSRASSGFDPSTVWGPALRDSDSSSSSTPQTGHLGATPCAGCS